MTNVSELPVLPTLFTPHFNVNVFSFTFATNLQFSKAFRPVARLTHRKGELA